MSLKLVKDGQSGQREDPARRKLRRWTVNMRAVAWIGDQPMTCVVHDISPGGARIQLMNVIEVAVGTTIELGLRDFPPISAEVRYSAEGTLGLMFLLEEDGQVELGRYLVSQRPERRDPRKKLDLKATLTPRRSQITCTVQNISRMGASVATNDARHFSLEEEIVLSIEGYGDVSGTVRRIGEGEVALMFHKALVGELPG